MKQLVLALSRLFREALLEVEEVLGAPSVRPVAPVSRPEVGTVVYRRGTATPTHLRSDWSARIPMRSRTHGGSPCSGATATTCRCTW